MSINAKNKEKGVEMKYYIFSNITGCHPSWTVAVLAINKTDATRRINGPMWRGGKFSHEVETSKVKASCGDVTEAAQAVLHQELEEEYQHCKTVEDNLKRILGRDPTWQEMVMAL